MADKEEAMHAILKEAVDLVANIATRHLFFSQCSKNCLKFELFVFVSHTMLEKENLFLFVYKYWGGEDFWFVFCCFWCWDFQSSVPFSANFRCFCLFSGVSFP